MPSRVLLYIALFVVMRGLAAPAAARAIEPAPPDDARRRIALDLAEEGRCEAALPELRAVESQPPSDAEVERAIGRCEIRLQDFRRAIAALESARSLDPGAPDDDVLLAIARYHAGDVAGSASALERAAARTPDRPEVVLYQGLVAFALAEYEVASERLETVSRLSERPAGPVGPFYLGRALALLGQRERALAAYRRVLDEWPGSPWAEQAARALAALERSDEPAVWGAVEVGFEHDDNALLRGRGVGRPGEIAGQSDQRAYWFVDLGAMLFERETVSSGVLLRYAGSEHHDLERFDTHAPGATLWLDHALGVADLSMRWRYDFDTAWIDAQSITDEVFVLSHALTAQVQKPWERGAVSIASVSVGFDDYRYDRRDLVVVDAPACPPDAPCSPAGVDELSATDRDGVGWGISLRHREPLPTPLSWLSEPWIEGEYLYESFAAKGREYDHQRHQIELGIGARLPLDLLLRVSGRYAYVPYANPSVFPDPSDVVDGQPYFLDPSARREQETGLRISLQRAFGEHVLVTARYARTRNHSTADVFSYTRDLIGLSVRIALGG